MSYSYDIYVEVNSSNKECLTNMLTATQTFYQLTQYPYQRPESKGASVTQSCSTSGAAYGSTPSTATEWPVSNSNTNTTNNIAKQYCSMGTGTVYFGRVNNQDSSADTIDQDYTSISPYNFSGFSSNVNNAVNLNWLFEKCLGAENLNTSEYIGSWDTVKYHTSLMYGYCPSQKPGGEHHGTAYTILTQSFQCSSPNQPYCCNNANTLTINNINGTNSNMPPDIIIGPFMGVFDPGSLLAGGTVANNWSSNGSSPDARCTAGSASEGSTDETGWQCQYFTATIPWYNRDEFSTSYYYFCPDENNYTPCCHYRSGANYGNCNVCGYVQFEISVPYYTLYQYKTSPNVSTDGVYTPPVFSLTQNNVGSYNVSPFSPTQTAVVSQAMSEFPNVSSLDVPSGQVVNQTQYGIPQDGWNFDTVKINYDNPTSSNEDFVNYFNNFQEYKVYGVFKLSYTLTEADFQSSDIQYKILDLLSLQQFLYTTYSAWFVQQTSYWTTTASSLSQIVTDFCNISKSMDNNLCQSMNLGFDFLQESPCIKSPVNCMQGWASYCNSETNFFSDLCQSVYLKSYNADGNINPSIETVLTTNCAKYVNETDEANLNAEYLRTCGCYLPESTYEQFLEADESTNKQLGGYDARQCWYLPCVLSNLQPIDSTKYNCPNNDITKCVQSTIANFQDSSGTLADNHIVVKSYMDSCSQNSSPNISVNVNSSTEEPSLPPLEISSSSTPPSFPEKKFIFQLTPTMQFLLLSFGILAFIIFCKTMIPKILPLISAKKTSQT